MSEAQSNPVLREQQASAVVRACGTALISTNIGGEVAVLKMMSNLLVLELAYVPLFLNFAASTFAVGVAATILMLFFSYKVLVTLGKMEILSRLMRSQPLKAGYLEKRYQKKRTRAGIYTRAAMACGFGALLFFLVGAASLIFGLNQHIDGGRAHASLPAGSPVHEKFLRDCGQSQCVVEFPDRQ